MNYQINTVARDLQITAKICIFLSWQIFVNNVCFTGVDYFLHLLMFTFMSSSLTQPTSYFTNILQMTSLIDCRNAKLFKELGQWLGVTMKVQCRCMTHNFIDYVKNHYVILRFVQKFMAQCCSLKSLKFDRGSTVINFFIAIKVYH